MIDNYSIVNTTLGDLKFIYWMFEEAIIYIKKNNYVGWTTYDKNYIKQDIDNKLQYKIVENNTIVCVFSVCFADPLIWREKDNGTSIYLHRITVNPKYKGQNQFAKVLNWAVKYVKKNQLDSIRMDTWANNPTILKYYKSYGFHHLENYTTPDVTALPMQHRNLKVALLEMNC